MTITRKIEVRVNVSTKEELSSLWNRLRDIGYYAYRAANQAISDYHIAQVLYFQTDIVSKNKEEKLASSEKREIQKDAFHYIFGEKEGYKEGIDNRVYQRITESFPMLPSAVASSLTRITKQQYEADKKNGLLSGDRSIRNYRRGMPIPCPKSVRTKTEMDENGELHFSIYGIPFVSVHLPKDNSNFMLIVQNVDNIRDSNLIIDGKKIYLMAAFDVAQETPVLDKTRVVGVDLGLKIPAVCALNEGYGRKYLGDISALLKKQALDRQYNRSKSSIMVKGGHGRRKVDKTVSRISGKEGAFAKNLNHIISKRIVEFTEKNGAGTIKMEALTFNEQKERFAKTIRYWGYAQLQSMVEYKAKMKGIDVIYVKSAYTSQKCSECGHVAKENRKDQAHFECVACGKKMNADLNAAINIARSTEICGKDSSLEGQLNEEISS